MREWTDYVCGKYTVRVYTMRSITEFFDDDGDLTFAISDSVSDLRLMASFIQTWERGRAIGEANGRVAAQIEMRRALGL